MTRDKKPQSPIPSYSVMCVSSCVAGVAGRVFCHPLDTVKARLQAPGGAAFRGIGNALRSTLSKEGVRGLYRGFSAVVVGGAPATCLYLMSYEVSKSTLLESNKSQPVWAIHLFSGFLAETVSCVVFVPVDVVKERLQVQQPPSPTAAAAAVNGGGEKRRLYRGSFDALRVITNTEGLKGIYRGYGATLLSFGPFSALHFVFYERLKEAALAGSFFSSCGDDKTAKKVEEISPASALACASTSSALAAWLTSPLDMAKLRMQVERGGSAGTVIGGSGGGTGGGVASASGLVGRGGGGVEAAPAVQQYPTMTRSLKHIFRTGGFTGLWRGALARVFFTAPNTAITMVVYEQLKNAM